MAEDQKPSEIHAPQQFGGKMPTEEKPQEQPEK